MYKVFKSVPREQRQKAFDFLVEHGYFNRVIGSNWPRCDARYDGYYVCPLGALNIAAGCETPIVRTKSYDDYWFAFRPQNGTVASLSYFRFAGEVLNSNAAEYFIKANDHSRFDTPEKLARAMGVQYKGQASHE